MTPLLVGRLSRRRILRRRRAQLRLTTACEPARTTTTPTPTSPSRRPSTPAATARGADATAFAPCSNRASRSWIAGIGPSTASITLRRSSENGVALALPGGSWPTRRAGRLLASRAASSAAPTSICRIWQPLSRTMSTSRLRNARQARLVDRAHARAPPARSLHRRRRAVRTRAAPRRSAAHEPILRTVRYDCFDCQNTHRPAAATAASASSAVAVATIGQR